MTALWATRGLPGSGKTHLARAWVAENPSARARINRDDLRVMLHDSVFIEGGTEAAVLVARDAVIRALLAEGADVICDDTNLPAYAVKSLAALAAGVGVSFEVIDLTAVPLEVCLERNATRTGRARVPEERIAEMYERYIARRPFPAAAAEA